MEGSSETINLKLCVEQRYRPMLLAFSQKELANNHDSLKMMLFRRVLLFWALCVLWCAPGSVGCKWGLRAHECFSARDCSETGVCKSGRCVVDEIESEHFFDSLDASKSDGVVDTFDAIHPDRAIEPEPSKEQISESVELCEKNQLSCSFAIRLGGSGTDKAEALAVNKQGEIYIAGLFSGRATFGGTTFTSVGNTDMFVAKIDSKGALIWAKQFGGKNPEFVYDLALGKDGEVYIAGKFHTETRFDKTYQAMGQFDAFVVKMDSNGGVSWVRSVRGNYENGIYAISVDDDGNVYGVGHFSHNIYLGKRKIGPKGETDVFVAKWNKKGEPQWIERMGGAKSESARDITVDRLGNVYVTGTFREQAQFGSEYPISRGERDLFVAKLSPKGDFLWTKGFGGKADEFPQALLLDSDGNLYLTGSFGGTAIFKDSSIRARGGSDIFVAKLDGKGEVLWVIQAGGGSADSGQDLVIDKTGHLYVSGNFGGTAAFGKVTLRSKSKDTTSSASEIFVAKLDAKGSFRWARRSGSGQNGIETAFGIGADEQGSIYSAGSFVGKADFGPNTLDSKGSTDVFVWKTPSKP